MLSRRFATIVDAARRALPALGLAAVLVLSTLGPPPPARAEHQMAHDPTARIQIVINSVDINEDHDFGTAGDLKLQAMVYQCPRPTWDEQCDATTITYITEFKKPFSAESGETETIDRTLPGADAPVHANGYGSAETGLSVYSGQSYVLWVRILEVDETDIEELGIVRFYLDETNGWGNGSHALPSDTGDFAVNFEVRRTPLANLIAHSFEIADVPGSTDKLVCARVVNAGLGEAGPFDVIVRIDSSTPPGGKMRVPGLGSGKTALSCFQTDRLGPGRDHFLSLNVDEAREVPEMDEVSNQHLSQMYTPRTSAVTATDHPLVDIGQADPNQTPGSNPPSGGSSPPPPSTAQADLVVSAIRVNGKNPGANDACEEGKNDVAVVVKNQGTAPAGSSVARLVADDEDDEKPVGNLEPGEEQEVRFDDVRLKKGERELTATADAKKTVSESNEDNNERTVTATCKDDDD